jgi:hypothetical protein
VAVAGRGQAVLRPTCASSRPALASDGQVAVEQHGAQQRGLGIWAAGFLRSGQRRVVQPRV